MKVSKGADEQQTFSKANNFQKLIKPRLTSQALKHFGQSSNVLRDHSWKISNSIYQRSFFKKGKTFSMIRVLILQNKLK